MDPIYIYIYSNSVAVHTELTMKNLACSIPESSQQHYAMARINCEAESKMFEDALNQATRNQQKMNEHRLFLCSVIQELPSEEDIQSAHESSAQCHESTNELDLEAWGDVNNCKLDPVKVRKAREEEMEYFRRMQVYRKVPIQRCKDEAGKLPIKVRRVDTNKQDESNPKYRSRLVAKDCKKHSDPELYTATPL